MRIVLGKQGFGEARWFEMFHVEHNENKILWVCGFHFCRGRHLTPAPVCSNRLDCFASLAMTASGSLGEPAPSAARFGMFHRSPRALNSRRRSSGMSAPAPAKRSGGASVGFQIAPALEGAAGAGGDRHDLVIQLQRAAAHAGGIDEILEADQPLPDGNLALDHPVERAAVQDFVGAAWPHARDMGVDEARIVLRAQQRPAAQVVERSRFRRRVLDR